MKGSWLLLAATLGLSQFAFAEKQEHTPVLPDGLKSEVPEVPADRNQFLRFLELPPTPPDLAKRTDTALMRLRKGEHVEDGGLLDELRKRQRLVRETLKPPLEFGPDLLSSTVPLLGLFKGSELLARQALLERDDAAADEYLDDLLRWSRLLRHARPNMVQWLPARMAWKLAFDAMLQDLGTHPAPAKRLDVIQEKFRQNPIESSELVEMFKAEARWSFVQGGIREMLKRRELAEMGGWQLKPPFNKLNAEDLASLPYDLEADFRRDSADVLANLAALKQNVPLSEWTGFQSHAVERTFEDYKHRANGLGDLFYEQSDPSGQLGFWNLALSSKPLLEGCLRWLETERGGGVIHEELFRDLLDPVDGKPLTVDLKSRTVRSRGLNRKVDAPEKGELPMPAAGFRGMGDDLLIVVPKWRSDKGVRKD